MSLAPEFRKISESLRDHLPQPRPRALTDEQIDALASIVGDENVSADPIELSRMARTTLPDSTTPAGILWASCREQVQAVVGWAAAHDFPIYPISTGKNWGYGDLCAPVAGCLLLDLSRMNRILEVDVALAYAVVEPGVTQGQLAEHLEEQSLPLMVDATGAGPDASLIGNTLERGFGHTAYGDRSAHVACLEAVLPDGSLLTTGFGAYANSRCAISQPSDRSSSGFARSGSREPCVRPRIASTTGGSSRAPRAFPTTGSTDARRWRLRIRNGSSESAASGGSRRGV